jgi:hypothetical protein
MNMNQLNITTEQVNQYIRELLAIPDKPVGNHLTEDEAINYSMESLSDEEEKRVDTHLSSCLNCAAEMEQFITESAVWDGPEGAKRLENLRDIILAKMADAQKAAGAKAAMAKAQKVAGAKAASIQGSPADILKGLWEKLKPERPWISAYAEAAGEVTESTKNQRFIPALVVRGNREDGLNEEVTGTANVQITMGPEIQGNRFAMGVWVEPSDLISRREEVTLILLAAPHGEQLGSLSLAVGEEGILAFELPSEFQQSWQDIEDRDWAALPLRFVIWPNTGTSQRNEENE